MPELMLTIAAEPRGRSEFGFDARNGHEGSTALSWLCQPDLYGRLSCEYLYPKFVKQIEIGDFLALPATLKETSALPAVCGRVCPQENSAKRSVFIYQNEKKRWPLVIWTFCSRLRTRKRKHFGTWSGCTQWIKDCRCWFRSGPGLAFAGDMAKLGYDVTVYEAFTRSAAYWNMVFLSFVCPTPLWMSKLKIWAMGVKFITQLYYRKTISIDDLKEEGYKGVFVASGAGLPGLWISKAKIWWVGCLQTNTLPVSTLWMQPILIRIRLLIGKHVAVIGGGNGAMDSVRTARRLGASRAYDCVSPFRRGNACPSWRSETCQRRDRIYDFAKSDKVYWQRARPRGIWSCRWWNWASLMLQAVVRL